MRISDWSSDVCSSDLGRYHVLGGRLSALDGVRPEDLNIASLLARIEQGGVDEVVLAMNATLEGQTTAHSLAERLEAFPLRVTQLAHGLPVGGEQIGRASVCTPVTIAQHVCGMHLVKT